VICLSVAYLIYFGRHDDRGILLAGTGILTAIAALFHRKNDDSGWTVLVVSLILGILLMVI
jgi:hypothetical protein